MTRRTGRRPGESGTRAAILEAARSSFSAGGYDGATIRDVARRAGVDPALVHHYFENKRKLFIAAVEVPVDPAEIVASVVAGDEATLGKRIAHTFLGVWDAESNRSPIVALLRSAASNEDAARMMREFVETEIFGAIAEKVALSDPALRASLVASQLIGVAWARYIIRVEPMASASRDQLAAIIAPTLQRYLAGDLTAEH